MNSFMVLGRGEELKGTGMEEIVAPADGEKEVAIKGVFDSGKEQRPCAFVRREKHQAAEEGEGEGESIAKGKMRETEDGGTDKGLKGNGKKRGVADGIEGSEEDALGNDRNQRVKYHHECPEFGALTRESEPDFRSIGMAPDG